MAASRVTPDPSELPASNRTGRRLRVPERRIDVPYGNIVACSGGYIAEVNGYAVPAIFNVDRHEWQNKFTGASIPRDDSRSITLEFPPLPELPSKTKAIPKIVHSVWVGEPIPEHLLRNLLANRRKLPRDFEFQLHLDVAPRYFAQLATVLRERNIKAVDMRQECFFNQSDIPDFNDHYENLMEIGIFAANSDLVRFPILSSYGGMYMDLDDEILRTCSRMDWVATDDILLGMPTRSMNGQDTHGMLNNTPIAATRGSRICHAIATEISVRLTSCLTSLGTEGSAAERETRLFQLTGPTVMHDVLSDWMPDVIAMSQYEPGNEQAVVIDNTLYAAYVACLNQRLKFYFPFSDGIRIGNEGSWRVREDRIQPDASGI